MCGDWLVTVGVNYLFFIDIDGNAGNNPNNHMWDWRYFTSGCAPARIYE